MAITYRYCFNSNNNIHKKQNANFSRRAFTEYISSNACACMSPYNAFCYGRKDNIHAYCQRVSSNKDVFLGNEKTAKHRIVVKRSNMNLAKRSILFSFLWLAQHSMFAICLWPEYCRAWDSELSFPSVSPLLLTHLTLA